MNNNNFNIGTFNSNNAAVNLGGTVEGNQIGTQTNYTFPNPKSAESINAVSQLIQDIRKQHPQASDAEIINIIEHGFETMRQTNPQKLRRWLDLFSIVFAGGSEAVKIVAPPLGIPIEVGKRLYEICDRNRKQLPNS
ncbi:MAG: hypothetical protein VKL59_02055 [Nostocaceae cyanobacterium]|nr:hypothetical protein [Nostocaceae cyanobacterium]